MHIQCCSSWSVFLQTVLCFDNHANFLASLLNYSSPSLDTLRSKHTMVTKQTIAQSVCAVV